MFPLPLASGLCVKTWAVVLWNLCEVSHRGGGSSSKFKNVLGIMQNLVWSVPDVRAQSFSLSASGRMPDLMEQWFCDKFSREHWIKILMLTAILSCEDAQSLPYAFLSHLEGLKYISVCKHIYLDNIYHKNRNVVSLKIFTVTLPFQSFSVFWMYFSFQSPWKGVCFPPSFN